MQAIPSPIRAEITLIGLSEFLGPPLSKTEQSNPSNVTTYTWDARNRLTGINALGITATFQYDALGRRVTKTVNGQLIGYVYDGAQAIGELTGGGISATLLTTLAIDDVVARYSQAGSRTYLTDALGSVLALAKDDQSIQAFYSYTPYGESQALGNDEGNPIQYTARENDQTGLYYYRARYYDPVLKRFISEDPIGIAGGLNLAAYVEGDPVSLNDPEGEIAPMLVGALIGGITSAVLQYATTGCIDWQQVAVGAAFGAVGGGLGGALQKLGQVRRAYNASNQAALAANPGMTSAQASAIRTANQISGQAATPQPLRALINARNYLTYGNTTGAGSAQIGNKTAAQILGGTNPGANLLMNVPARGLPAAGGAGGGALSASGGACGCP